MILRYPQSKEQTAELLRVVLARMGQHDAAFNPLTYTVWFEYAAGMNAQLNQALDQLVQAHIRLTDADLRDLYQAHIADVDPQAMHRIGTELQQVMATLADAAGSTGSNADQFGVQLGTLAVGLQAINNKLTAPMILQALESTALMRDSAQALESEIKFSQSEIGRLQSELTRVRDESRIDALTQVLNRKGFDEKLASMLARPAPEGRLHGLIMFDIDYFKKVNDTHGHVMGDRVLQALGEVLKSCIPPHSSASVARYGGEEFAMLVPATTPDECHKLAELVRTRTKALKVRDRRTQAVVLTVTISGGMALHQAGEDAHSLTVRADAALYRSKQVGRDHITCV
ncbi:GGDEF domain-containing protein [Rhodoferax antarcticus]|uniref:GGDEF domain-containing protein n=1 Tax=Rhodoferax antarcticus TaxID=81479 RepID=UPI0022252EFC|nr:GGDEF domain-containing protein [Rhodoferax antarcticus]MCW2313288.1 diguanylate cyclase [Rhodoferax antarcticus]